MITLILCAVLAIFIADAIYTRGRIKLRMRAAQAASKLPGHHLTGSTGSGGWRPLEEIHREADTQTIADENPFTRIGHSHSRPRR